ncbi:30S ribosomal protein S3 [Candidatus Peregrinibacteria bacterium CG22_combo_CG10-13_8_21_14_all_44_10]|nr:MAG: 30S ribosomal protein S3 [Candidatus Peregrinibacteria bacterium CG2_30_44_17]PIP66056.1 MAG: 30S ribosomal protein S3 [Candidatus Peregrinibacteria bacterium CG22_combo_CG10-13_8_21_14_all_44_10]PIS03628.1 MAG: 30S ribosomal protein S3 [Candidatus Peregrinibacteria bacterium CG10_big_fil_rev_8_21_14_0_10_44_7]PIX78890.1 MAG: 30S ribosomal protein S3 [Candidatus Peregrinibacteria bacterium CG_4_10_14_3_um_filter_44_21]PJB88859.1 MAG: 30S ribosomal protein S3 [Candidatus Peregrinibacteri
MGQKVNPKIQRIGIIRGWDSSWYAGKGKYTQLFHEDIKVRKYILDSLKDCGISRVQILRNANETTINIYSAKPGVIIGRQGEDIDKLRGELENKFGNRFQINVSEIQAPDLDATLVAQSITKQIERRISYRRAAKMAIQRAMEGGAQGIKILAGGRLNGVEISRREFFSEGKIPLHTFRADIDYGTATARTTYGAIGLKVWIYKGEIFKKDLERTVNPHSKALVDKAAEPAHGGPKRQAPRKKTS